MNRAKLSRGKNRGEKMEEGEVSKNVLASYIPSEPPQKVEVKKWKGEGVKECSRHITSKRANYAAHLSP